MLTTSSCSISGNLLPLQQSQFTSFMNEHILTRYVQMHCSLTHLNTQNFLKCTFHSFSLYLSPSLSLSISLHLSLPLSLSLSICLSVSVSSLCLSLDLSLSLSFSLFLALSVSLFRYLSLSVSQSFSVTPLNSVEWNAAFERQNGRPPTNPERKALARGMYENYQRVRSH